MAGGFNLGGFSGQLTAEELQNALAAIQRPTAPQPAPEPVTPVSEQSPSMAVQRVSGNPTQAIRQYQDQNLADQNARIELAGSAGDSHGLDSRAYDEMAAIYERQGAAAKANTDAAKADVVSRKEHEKKYQGEADRIYEQMKASASPPSPSKMEKVLGIIAAVSAIGGNKGIAQGASMLSGLLGQDKERWAQEQAANSNLYKNALMMVDSDRAGARSDLEVAQRLSALEAHEYDAALEQAKSSGLGRNAQRIASDLQLRLREETRNGLIRMEADKQKAFGAGQRSARENYFYSIPLDQLRQMPSNILGKDGQEVLAKRTKDDQSYRKGEADIRKTQGDDTVVEAGQLVPGGRRISDPSLYTQVDKPTLTRYVQGEDKARRALRNIAELKALVQEHGTETLPSKTKSRMEQLGAQIQLDMKDAGELGALDKGSAEYLARLTGDPTAWNFGLGNLVENVDTKLDEAANMIRYQTESRAKSLGLEHDRAVLSNQKSAPPDPRVRRGFSAPSAASRGVSTSSLPSGVTLEQVRDAAEQLDRRDALDDETQARIAEYLR